MKTKLLCLSLLVSAFASAQTIGLEPFATGFIDPIEIVHAGDERLFVAQQDGVIRILNADGSISPTPFLDITPLISLGSERGLLGLAFHPDYEENGFFYVNYTDEEGDTVVSRFSVSEDNPNIADADSEMILLTVDQPFENHNGGCIRFGPDGYLYISMGDGGSGGDPNNNGQNINSLLGKLLRIDVDNGAPYSNPAGNPFIGANGADEIWAYGLRNAWKFSFNRLNGDLWIADVGQESIEEINRVTSTQAGLNYGWRCYEGNNVYNNAGCGDASMYIMPIAQYTHDNGCSITGGYVYTGSMYPTMQGKYFFADFCTSVIGMVDDEGEMTLGETFDGNITTFGEDMNGELYVAGKTNGNVYRLVDTSLSTEDINKSAFAVYPNPASDVVNITSSAGNKVAGVAIFDLSGKLLISQTTDNAENTGIDTSRFPSGFYLMTITAENGSKHNHKLTIR